MSNVNYKALTLWQCFIICYKMQYLIKDLSRLSGFTPARIRKWQERYNLFNPKQGENGYYYYSNEDLFLLKYISDEIQKGIQLKKILNSITNVNTSEKIASNTNLDENEIRLLNFLSNKKFDELINLFDLAFKSMDFIKFIDEYLQPSIVFVGKAWERGLISVADEHAFSHWVTLYLAAKLDKIKRDLEKKKKTIDGLITVFPGDEHELGALLLYAKMIYKGKYCRFLGMMPENELIKELYNYDYKVLYVSIVVPINKKELENFKKRIQSRFKNLKIIFGGIGNPLKS